VLLGRENHGSSVAALLLQIAADERAFLYGGDRRTVANLGRGVRGPQRVEVIKSEASAYGRCRPRHPPARASQWLKNNPVFL